MHVQIEAAALGRIMTALDQNQPARSVELSVEESAAVRPLYLLTMKPMVYAANVAEDDMADLGAANKHVQTMRNKAAKDGCELIIVSAQVRPGQVNKRFSACCRRVLCIELQCPSRTLPYAFNTAASLSVAINFCPLLNWCYPVGSQSFQTIENVHICRCQAARPSGSRCSRHVGAQTGKYAM